MIFWNTVRRRRMNDLAGLNLQSAAMLQGTWHPPDKFMIRCTPKIYVKIIFHRMAPPKKWHYKIFLA